MPKLSENQAAAIAGLNKLLSETDADFADKNAWRKAVAEGVSVNTNSLMKAGALTSVKVAVGTRVVDVFAPARVSTEVRTSAA